MSMVEPLTPWAESKEHDTDAERRLSRLLAAVPDAGALPEAARQRVGFRLRQRTSHSAGLMLVRLVAVGAVIGITGAAMAQWATVHWFGSQQEFSRRSVRIAADPPLVPQPILPVRPRPAETVVPEVVVPEAAVVATGAIAVAPVVAAPVVSAQSSRLGLEAKSLEAALSALRAGGHEQTQRALDALERHLRDFPRGSLELEARVARVDALLVLGRRQEARRELSALPIESVGRKNELRLIRAELRADDDCHAALADFQVLVEQSLPTAWAERALFGRGACLLKLGDKSAAQRDFARYLERYPNGRFAPQIRAQQQP